MFLRNKIKLYLYSIIVITIIWYVIFLILKTPIVPSPIIVYINIVNIFKEKISIHVLYSLGRIFIGIFISIAIGVPLGFLIGYYKKLDKFLSPLIYFTYPIPKMALLPIIMLLLGLGEASKIIMIVLIIIFQIIITARDSVKEIPLETYHALNSLGASKVQIFREIVLPASLSEVITATRLALGTAISILFFTETYGTQYGMGYLIMDSWMRVNYIEMYSGIVILSLMGVLIFSIIDIIEEYFCAWR